MLVNSTDITIEPKKQILFDPFPKQEEFHNLVASGKYSFILYGGAIRGGKTFAMLALFIILCKIFPGSRWALVRKDLPTIKRNLYPSWNKIKPTNFVKNHNNETHTVTFENGSQILFFPENYSQDKELDRWKGLEVNGFGFEEINECQQQSLEKAFERAGSYIVPNLKIQPDPLVVATCNPTQGWVKKLVYNPWKEGTLPKEWYYIQSRIYDNIPLLKAAPKYLENLKANLSKHAFMVFVDGNWDVQIKTGGELLREFELEKHVKPISINPETIFHVSLDSNVYPYISTSVYQLERTSHGWIIKQVEELPAEDPINTMGKAGKMVGEWLTQYQNKTTVKIYGDPSTKARNNIDEDKRSGFDIYIDSIKKEGHKVQDCMLPKAPPVAQIIEFVNEILAGNIPFISFQVAEHCVTSIGDFIETKTDKDGTMLKQRIKHPTIDKLTFEPHGHIVDNLKDFIASAFSKEFNEWLNKNQVNRMQGTLSGLMRGSLPKR